MLNLCNMLDYHPVQGKVTWQGWHALVLDSKTLVETVTQLKLSTGCLDTLPTNLFKKVFDSLAIDKLQIVNNSLQSGNFPKALKTAVTKPVLREKY